MDEFQVLQRKTRPCNHGIAVTRASVGTCAAEVGTTITTSGEDGLVTAETVEGTILHVESDNTNTLAVLHDQVESEVFDEEVCVVTKRLSVKGVEDSMASTVGGGGAAVSLAALAILQGLTTKRALVDLALFCPGERDTVVFKLK